MSTWVQSPGVGHWGTGPALKESPSYGMHSIAPILEVSKPRLRDVPCQKPGRLGQAEDFREKAGEPEPPAADKEAAGSGGGTVLILAPGP